VTRRPPHRRGPALLALGVLLSAPGLAADRVVAIGDIHGAYQEFVSILQETGLIGKDLHWTGGRTILVQTGDVIDRGPGSRQVLDLLIDLTETAPRQGGEVRPLLGNHEVMVMAGDLRYVAAEDYQAFVARDSERVRQREWENFVRYRKRRASRFRQPAPDLGAAEREAWLQAHPPGYFEFRQAFSPNGRYGRWLRRRDTVTQVDDTVFLHGGLAPDLPLRTLPQINERLRSELEVIDQAWSSLSAQGVLWRYLNFQEAQAEAQAEWEAQEKGSEPDRALQTFLSIGQFAGFVSNGPLWYRGYAEGPESELAGGLTQVLERFQVKRMIMGHTVTASRRITPRYDGRAVFIDTGMLAPYYQGRPSALEITGGKLQARYAGEPIQPVSEILPAAAAP
jgi:hypothetical protein